MPNTCFLVFSSVVPCKCSAAKSTTCCTAFSISCIFSTPLFCDGAGGEPPVLTDRRPTPGLHCQSPHPASIGSPKREYWQFYRQSQNSYRIDRVRVLSICFDAKSRPNRAWSTTTTILSICLLDSCGWNGLPDFCSSRSGRNGP